MREKYRARHGMSQMARHRPHIQLLTTITALISLMWIFKKTIFEISRLNSTKFLYEKLENLATYCTDASDGELCGHWRSTRNSNDDNWNIIADTDEIKRYLKSAVWIQQSSFSENEKIKRRTAPVRPATALTGPAGTNKLVTTITGSSSWTRWEWRWFSEPGHETQQSSCWIFRVAGGCWMLEVKIPWSMCFRNPNNRLLECVGQWRGEPVEDADLCRAPSWFHRDSIVIPPWFHRDFWRWKARQYLPVDLMIYYSYSLSLCFIVDLSSFLFLSFFFVWNWILLSFLFFLLFLSFFLVHKVSGPFSERTSFKVCWMVERLLHPLLLLLLELLEWRNTRRRRRRRRRRWWWKAMKWPLSDVIEFKIEANSRLNASDWDEIPLSCIRLEEEEEEEEEEVVSLLLSSWSSAVKKHPPVEWTDVSDRWSITGRRGSDLLPPMMLPPPSSAISGRLLHFWHESINSFQLILEHSSVGSGGGILRASSSLMTPMTVQVNRQRCGGPLTWHAPCNWWTRPGIHWPRSIIIHGTGGHQREPEGTRGNQRAPEGIGGKPALPNCHFDQQRWPSNQSYSSWPIFWWFYFYFLNFYQEKENIIDDFDTVTRWASRQQWRQLPPSDSEYSGSFPTYSGRAVSSGVYHSIDYGIRIWIDFIFFDWMGNIRPSSSTGKSTIFIILFKINRLIFCCEYFRVG